MLARKIEAAHAVAEGAAKLLFSKAFAVLLEAAALPAITRFQLALVQPLHELLVYMRPSVYSLCTCEPAALLAACIRFIEVICPAFIFS